jgi:hypothetical protein
MMAPTAAADSNHTASHSLNGQAEGASGLAGGGGGGGEDPGSQRFVFRGTDLRRPPQLLYHPHTFATDKSERSNSGSSATQHKQSVSCSTVIRTTVQHRAPGASSSTLQSLVN